MNVAGQFISPKGFIVNS